MAVNERPPGSPEGVTRDTRETLATPSRAPQPENPTAVTDAGYFAALKSMRETCPPWAALDTSLRTVEVAEDMGNSIHGSFTSGDKSDGRSVFSLEQELDFRDGKWTPAAGWAQPHMWISPELDLASHEAAIDLIEALVHAIRLLHAVKPLTRAEGQRLKNLAELLHGGRSG